MKTAIFLEDKEINLLTKLVKEHEENNYMSSSKKENDELFSLIDTLEKRGVEVRKPIKIEKGVVKLYKIIVKENKNKWITINEPKSSEPKSSEPKSSEPKSSEVKSSEVKSSEPKSSEPKSSENGYKKALSIANSIATKEKRAVKVIKIDNNEVIWESVYK